MASDTGSTLWGFVKKTAGKAKAAADDAQLKSIQARIRSSLETAQSYRDDDDVTAARTAIPDHWESLDLPASKALAKDALSTLESVLKQAAARREAERQAAVAQERRDKRYFEVIALLKDDGAVATFNAGAAMSDDEHKNFKRVLKSQVSHTSNNVHESFRAGAIGAMADNRFPDRIDYSCVVGQIGDAERQLLRIAAVLMRHDVIFEDWFEKALAGAIFYAGNARIARNRAAEERKGGMFRHGMEQVDLLATDQLTDALRAYLINENTLKQEMVSATSRLQKEHPNSPVVQELMGVAGGGASWFSSADAVGSIYQLEPGRGLFLGQLDDGGFLHYDGEGSLFTIAPPGSGKTQCQVMPNLVMYDGPAIVLDVKGECFEQTAGVRSRDYGPVLRFAPDDWENSCHYNPLDFVRDAPRYLATDARKLADMLIVPQAASDPYWEQRGRDVLAAIIGFVALNFDPKERNMKSVMDLLSPSPAMLEEVLKAMRETNIPFLERAANQIESMSEKQLSSIFDSARSQLSVWDLGELDPITDRSDWHPRDFKSGGRPLTLYLCVGPADIERFASVLRVIIGQHLDYFMDVLPDNVDTPIVFFLDEAPQLGSFEPLPKASSLGRQYGLRLWLFAQNRNQIEAAYKSADTILGNAVVQCWMNPDETAGQHLERNLGTTRSLFDGQDRPLVLSHELRGPEYKDTIICVGRGEKPAKLSKHFAYQDDSLKQSMGLAITAPELTQ